jgi:sugar/nucleoside kinase (ribokinase family)
MSGIEVVGVGNAIVDVIGQVDESFIDEWNLNKGSMTLIEEPRAEQLTGLMPDGLKESGGSAANTMVGVASFGVSAAYIGKVRNDELGAAFADGMREAGVAYDVTPADSGMATARCLIQVTPDGQRTMNTFLGASSRLTTADIDESLVAGASALYCEGYLWDLEEAKAAIRHAMDIARANGVAASFTLSDPFAVDRHRDEWMNLISDRVDLLFGNMEEAQSLLGLEDRDAIVSRLRDMCETSSITLGDEGSMVITADDLIMVPAKQVVKRVDTTGAGDLYAAGFLAGVAKGTDLGTAAAMGNCAASEVITHIGARPLVDLATHC